MAALFFDRDLGFAAGVSFSLSLLEELSLDDSCGLEGVFFAGGFVVEGVAGLDLAFVFSSSEESLELELESFFAAFGDFPGVTAVLPAGFFAWAFSFSVSSSSEEELLSELELSFLACFLVWGVFFAGDTAF